MTSLSNCINLNYYIGFKNPHASNGDVINVCSLKINVGILHLDPDAEYPEHVHYAEEIYQVDFAMDHYYRQITSTVVENRLSVGGASGTMDPRGRQRCFTQESTATMRRGSPTAPGT